MSKLSKKVWICLSVIWLLTVGISLAEEAPKIEIPKDILRQLLGEKLKELEKTEEPEKAIGEHQFTTGNPFRFTKYIKTHYRTQDLQLNEFDLFRMVFLYCLEAERKQKYLNSTISKDGRIVMFERYDGIAILDMARPGMKKGIFCTDNPYDTEPSVSGDGRRIVFVRQKEDNKEIYLLDLSLKSLMNLSDDKGKDYEPCISEDGNYVAFTSERKGHKEVYLADIARQTIMNLTSKGGYKPTISADGNNIAFVSKKEEPFVFVNGKGGDREIYVVDRKKKTLTNLSCHQADDYDPKISGDGKKVVFVSERNDTPGVYLCDLETETLMNLSKNDRTDHFPVISANGRIIAFVGETENWRGICIADLKSKLLRKAKLGGYYIYDKGGCNDNPISMSGDANWIGYYSESRFFTITLEHIKDGKRDEYIRKKWGSS